MTGCRIGKVTMKAGGAEIFRLPVLVPEETHQRLMQAARSICEYNPAEEIAGYFIAVWNMDGTYSSGLMIDEDSPIGVTMAPSYVADIIRRDLISGGDWR